MTVALSSLISGRPVRNDVAMTGEVTLTGQGAADRRAEGEVVGGAAGRDQAGDRAGAQRGRRRGDPEHELGGLEFVFVDEVSKAIDVALS